MTAAIPERMASLAIDSAASDARAATIEALYQQLAQYVPAQSPALTSAAELAVMVANSVADPVNDVFWDRADHAPGL